MSTINKDYLELEKAVMIAGTNEIDLISPLIKLLQERKYIARSMVEDKDNYEKYLEYFKYNSKQIKMVLGL